MTDLRFLSKLDGKFKNSPRRGVLFRCYGFFINILHDFLPFLACIVAGMTENKNTGFTYKSCLTGTSAEKLYLL